MTHIDLAGVALKQHDMEYLFDFEPYAHQLELQRLIGEEDEFVAVNDSPTGGGKTSSWLAPALAEKLDTIAVYPTNALVTDQAESLRDDTDVVDHDVGVMKVTSDTVYQRRSSYGVNSNGDALERWFTEERRSNDQVLFLTNPDILVMMCRDLYGNTSRAYKRIEFAVVDEFHRTGRKEQNTLRYLLDELYERDEAISRLQKIAFLSATPDEKQERAFEQAMTAPYRRLTEHGSNEQKAFTEGLGAEWHAVMPPVSLEIRSAPTFGTADVLLEQEETETLEFCRGGRTVIMLDGIHEVARVSEWLDDELERRVERIDGFHRENKAEKLREFDILVSNSAVEVGIDFADIDRLLFAGHDRASFIQRLGRLRTDEVVKQARCYVPVPVARDLDEHDGSSFTRRELDSLLGDIYPEPRKPESFDWRYSAVEARYHLKSRLQNATPDQREMIQQQGENRIRRHFLPSETKHLDRNDVERTMDALDWRVLTDLQWYRGDSIQALVYDAIKENLKPYSLFYLLRYGDVTFHERAEFERLLPGEKSEEVDRYSGFVDGFCTFHGTIEKTDGGFGRDVFFTGPRLAGWLDSEVNDVARKPKVLDGIKVQATCRDDSQPRIRTLDKLNKYLKNRSEHTPGNGGGLLCYPVQGKSKVIKEVYDLGPFFFLYPISVSGKKAHSLAIGTDALYLDCHVRERAKQRNQEDGEFIGL